VSSGHGGPLLVLGGCSVVRWIPSAWNEVECNILNPKKKKKKLYTSRDYMP
jgi:hypothetical protein